MKDTTFTKYTVPAENTALEAMKQIDALKEADVALLVVEGEKVVGALSDGDIRRGLLRGLKTNTAVREFMQSDFRFLVKGRDNVKQVIKFREQDISTVPYLSEDGKLLEILNLNKTRSIIPVDAVLMAGGEGKRLRPYTADTPKPMIEVGGKPIIETNIDRLVAHGVKRINISIKYLGHKIENYFTDGSNKGILIDYTKEDFPLGTLGSVSLIDEIYSDVILVMNSDLLTNIDFEKFYMDFIEKGADMSVAATEHVMDVPYAVLETTDGNEVSAFKEKPSYSYYCNAGIYLIKKSLLKHVPENKEYNTTDLMDVVIDDDALKLVTFPISGYWKDIGRAQDLEQARLDYDKISF